MDAFGTNAMSFGRAIDQPADLRAHPVHVVVPRQEIPACQFIAMSEMLGDGFGGAARQLAEGCGVEVGPIASAGNSQRTASQLGCVSLFGS